MEIALDFKLVRAILAGENREARDDIRRDGPLRAYENSQHRHDARVSSAADHPTLACRSGCTWCCHFSVDVRAVEVFRILDFVARELPPAEQERVRREIQANSAALRGLDEMQRMRRNVKCPFLSAGRCTIYAARPQTCRNYHATDARGCEQSYEEPDNMEIDPEFAPLVYQAGGAHVDAFSTAMRDAGYDISVYELNTALEAAMSGPKARERFEAGQAPFPDLDGEEVELEFAEAAQDAIEE